MVLDHLPGDPRHLRWLPCEHIGICLEEGDEREFLFFLQITHNASGLGGICAELDGLDGDVVRFGWPNLWHFGRRPGTRGQGVPPSVVWASSFCRQGCNFSIAASAAARSPRTVRTPAGDDILRTKYS
jgi:hypothetical protein